MGQIIDNATELTDFSIPRGGKYPFQSLCSGQYFEESASAYNSLHGTLRHWQKQLPHRTFRIRLTEDKLRVRVYRIA